MQCFFEWGKGFWSYAISLFSIYIISVNALKYGLTCMQTKAVAYRMPSRSPLRLINDKKDGLKCKSSFRSLTKVFALSNCRNVLIFVQFSKLLFLWKVCHWFGRLGYYAVHDFFTAGEPYHCFHRLSHRPRLALFWLNLISKYRLSYEPFRRSLCRLDQTW